MKTRSESEQYREAYREGYNAFEKDLMPSDCPYLNEYGDNPNEIIDWIQGWTDAYCEKAI